MGNTETRGAAAAELFLKGYNCAQSVVGAFADELDMDFETLMKLSSSFGGGVGGLREVCGAVSGMAMVLGLLKGYSSPDDYDEKKEHYAAIQYLAQDFKNQHETIICRELLNSIKKPLSAVPQERTPRYYKERPCATFVYTAAEILDKYLKEIAANKENCK